MRSAQNAIQTSVCRSAQPVVRHRYCFFSEHLKNEVGNKVRSGQKEQPDDHEVTQEPESPFRDQCHNDERQLREQPQIQIALYKLARRCSSILYLF